MPKINFGDGSPDTIDLPTLAQQKRALPSLMLVGMTGTGKTRLIAEPIARGQYVLNIHSGTGEPGDATVESYLKKSLGPKKGQEAYEERYKSFWAQGSDDLITICQNGWNAVAHICSSNPGFAENIDVLAFEEFNSGQGRYERTRVPINEDGVPNITALSTKGAGDGALAHYGGLNMATVYILERIHAINSPYKPLRLIVTTHLSKSLDVLGDKNDLMVGPNIRTKAVSEAVGSFSYVIGLARANNAFDDTPYWTYNYAAASSLFKARGEDWPASSPADPVKLWDVLEGKANPSTLNED